MGWADWPARLQHLAPGPLVGNRDVWLDGGHNPSAARQIAASRSVSSPTASRCTSSSPASRPRTPPACSSRSRAWSNESMPSRSPTTAASRPSDLVEIAGKLGFAAEAHDRRAAGACVGAGRRAGADFRLALPCRRGARRQRAGARLGFRRFVDLGSGVPFCAPLLRCHPRPLEQDE